MERVVTDFPALNLKPAGTSRESCTACRFWQTERMEKTQQGVVAPCRRYPPVLVLGPNLQPLPGQAPVVPVRMPSPNTLASEWCGEFQRSP